MSDAMLHLVYFLIYYYVNNNYESFLRDLDYK